MAVDLVTSPGHKAVLPNTYHREIFSLCADSGKSQLRGQISQTYVLIAQTLGS